MWSHLCAASVFLRVGVSIVYITMLVLTLSGLVFAAYLILGDTTDIYKAYTEMVPCLSLLLVCAFVLKWICLIETEIKILRT